MVSVNRTPFNIIPKKWAFDSEIGPFVREILDIIFQLRNRTGGETDTIADIELESIYNRLKVLNQLRAEIGLLSDELSQVKRHNRSLEQKIYELSEIISQNKRLTRTTEQKINELTERYDSGA